MRGDRRGRHDLNPASRGGLLRLVAALVVLAAAGAAEAQVNLQVATAPGDPPIANAVTRGRPSSVSFDVTNSRAGTRLRELRLRLPVGYAVSGGAGPAGWTVTYVSGRWIYFRISSCALDGLASGASGSFRVDATPPTTAIASDLTDRLSTVNALDPCGGPTGWTVTTASSVTWQRKTLLVTGSVAPAQGAPPLAVTTSWTVTNLSSGTRTVTPSPAVAPATGWTGGTCSPASLSLASGASGSFTCTHTGSAAGAFRFAATATGSNGTSAVGAVAGTVTVGAATATFAFDARVAGPGDQVRATLSVRNQGATTITATPPTYAGLVLQNLARTSGTTDPAARSIPAGGTADFVYLLDVTGVVGATYVAQGAASTTLGPTNLAVTPAGTVSASRVEWTPPAVVKARTASPYVFAVSVTNGSSSAVNQVRVVNPQNGLWTVMANAGGSTGLTYNTRVINGSTTYLAYTGTLAPGATATLRFQFTAVPTVTQTTSYPFQVQVYQSGGGSLVTTYSVTAAVALPIPDVGGLTILSTDTGQVLSWVNTSRTDAPHDGVVVFRSAAPAVPTVPADFVDYGVPANRPADFFYEDGEASAATTLADPATGAWNYRVCNRDALFVYSNCNSGFWNGQGWLDSAVAPVGGWTHQLGGAVLLLPGVVPGGRVGVATNAPSLAIVDLATGDRSFDPVPLGSLPSGQTPAAVMGDGRSLFLASDTGGNVLAYDLGAGAIAWQSAKAGESFVSGVGGIVRQYAPATFQAAYPFDVLFLGSTSGRVLALNAWTGATLWTVDTGVAAGVRALPWYDTGTNRLYVATNGGGILAYDLAGSGPSTPPAALAGWTNPGGTYRIACGRAPTTTEFACADTAGTLRLLAKDTGAVVASLETGATSPSALQRIIGTSPGFVVSNASRVVRVSLAGAPPVLSVAGQYAPGSTLSPAQAFPGDGTIVVAASDLRLHKLALADAADTGQSVQITPQPASVLLGPPAYDAVNDLFVFGTEDGRLWAVRKF